MTNVNDKINDTCSEADKKGIEKESSHKKEFEEPKTNLQASVQSGKNAENIIAKTKDLRDRGSDIEAKAGITPQKAPKPEHAPKLQPE